MAQNLTEVRALFGHGLRSGLAESDAMSLAGSFQSELIMLRSFTTKSLLGTALHPRRRSIFSRADSSEARKRGGIAAGDTA